MARREQRLERSGEGERSVPECRARLQDEEELLAQGCLDEVWLRRVAWVRPRAQLSWQEELSSEAPLV